jgi:carbon monoxide dehydrogenase subunit G
MSSRTARFVWNFVLNQMQNEMKTQNDFTREINSKAPVVFRQSITINAEREKVWSILTDINGWSKWQAEIKTASLEGEPIPGNTFTWHSGGTLIRSKIHTNHPSSNFGWTGGMPGLRAVHNWILENNDGQTVVKVEESMEGLLAKFLRSKLNRTLEESLESWLSLLKKQSEKTSNQG